MSHGQTRIHKTHHGPDLGEATTFLPYRILCGYPQGPQPNDPSGSPEMPRLGLPQLWGPITLRADLEMR